MWERMIKSFSNGYWEYYTNIDVVVGVAPQFPTVSLIIETLSTVSNI